MVSKKAIRATLPALLLAACLAAAPAAGRSLAQEAAQDPRVVQAEGLRLVRHADDTYELAADGVGLELLAARLAEISGVELSVAPELLATAVTVETERIALSRLLEQLSAAMGVNLIMAGNASAKVSRAWLTATSATTPSTGTLAAPTANNVNGTPANGQMLQGTTPPPGMMPVPTGSEVRAAGYDPNLNVAEYIRSQSARAHEAADRRADNAASGAEGAAGTGATGQPGETAEAEAPAGPPIPMDPNALENYFAGDSTAKTYHRLNCIQAMYLPAANKIWFKSRQEAIAAGYEPHDICIAR